VTVVGGVAAERGVAESSVAAVRRTDEFEGCASVRRYLRVLYPRLDHKLLRRDPSDLRTTDLYQRHHRRRPNLQPSTELCGMAIGVGDEGAGRERAPKRLEIIFRAIIMQNLGIFRSNVM